MTTMECGTTTGRPLDVAAEKQRALRFAYNIPGQTWPNELGWLFEVMHPFALHAEIGAYCGRSLYVTAAGMHLLGEGQHTILAVEPTGFTGDAAWDGQILKSTIAKIHRDFPSVRVEHVPKLAVDAYRDLAAEVRNELDSVFTDASHEYAETTAEIATWGEAARSFVSGHDYWPRHPGVMDAVNEAFPEFDVVSGMRVWCVDKRLRQPPQNIRQIVEAHSLTPPEAEGTLQ